MPESAMPESAGLAQQGGVAGPPDWLAALLGGSAWLMFSRLRTADSIDDPFIFQMASQRGWAVAICLAAAGACRPFESIRTNTVAGFSPRNLPTFSAKQGSGYALFSDWLYGKEIDILPYRPQLGRPSFRTESFVRMSRTRVSHGPRIAWMS